VILAVAYAVVPYALGVLAAGGRVDRLDVLLCAALYALFLGRIVLKDFRDREGDAAYGKPTLLLVHGKTVTCAVTAAALLAGCSILSVALGGGFGLAAVVGCFGAMMLAMLSRLLRTSEPRVEQVAIGLGAKAGNGLLAATLAWLTLEAAGAPTSMRIVVVAFLALVYGSVIASLLRRPGEIEIVYKG
jgi:4-hydroxybenzoate polyprenyltransferase